MTSIWYMTRTMDDFSLKIENWIIKKQTLGIRNFNQKNKKMKNKIWQKICEERKKSVKKNRSWIRLIWEKEWKRNRR